MIKKDKENPITPRLINPRFPKLFEISRNGWKKKTWKMGYVRTNGIRLVEIGQWRGKDRQNGAMARTYLKWNFPTYLRKKSFDLFIRGKSKHGIPSFAYQ